jgi:hypothetical protein
LMPRAPRNRGARRVQSPPPTPPPQSIPPGRSVCTCRPRRAPAGPARSSAPRCTHPPAAGARASNARVTSPSRSHQPDIASSPDVGSKTSLLYSPLSGFWLLSVVYCIELIWGSPRRILHGQIALFTQPPQPSRSALSNPHRESSARHIGKAKVPQEALVTGESAVNHTRRSKPCQQATGASGPLMEIQQWLPGDF